MNPAENHDDPSGTPASDRLLRLEERLSFQQRLLDDLNGEVLAQRRELERLARDLGVCRNALERLLEAPPGVDLPHEKPPHY
jgi:uncharacterized coiled-coil protein SlyX